MSANYTANVKDNWNAECTGETTHILTVNKKKQFNVFFCSNQLKQHSNMPI